MGRLSSNDASCEEGKAAENARKQMHRMMMWQHIMRPSGLVDNEGFTPAVAPLWLSITHTISAPNVGTEFDDSET